MGEYRFMIGAPHVGDLPGYAVDSLLALVKPKEGFLWQRASGMPVDVARNFLVRAMLEQGAEWLLQIDADMQYHPDSLKRLAERVTAPSTLRPFDPSTGSGYDRLRVRQAQGTTSSGGASVDMVGALCFTRYVPPVPSIFRDVTRRVHGHEFLRIQVEETRQWLEAHPEAMAECPTVLDPAPEDAMVRADATGGAFLLVHRRVFEAIEHEYAGKRGLFGRRRAARERELYGGPWFRRDQVKKGEDFLFFQRARKLGFQLWIDRSVIVKHMWGDSGGIGPEAFVAYQSVYPFERVIET